MLSNELTIIFLKTYMAARRASGLYRPRVNSPLFSGQMYITIPCRFIIHNSFGSPSFSWSRDSSVVIAMDYRLNGRCSIPVSGKRLFSYPELPEGSGSHPASYPMGIGA
jgi:hypothetical protein